MPEPRPAHAEQLALLVDAVQDYSILLLSPAGVVLSWNRGAARIFRYQESEIVGRPFSVFYGRDDLALQKAQHELEAATRDGRVEDEGWRLRKDGSRFWADTVLTVLLDDSGGVRGFAEVTRDMTVRREADEQLRQGREIFELLVSSVREYAIFMLDPDGNVATWNSGAQQIKGYLPEEIIGRHFSTFYPEEDLRDGKPERELRVAREQGSIEDEGWRLRKDGTRFWANVVITAIYDGQRRLRGFAKVTRDNTDRKEAEETQRALMEQREARLIAEGERRRAESSYLAAEEANRAKDEFLMTLSHELRTPMTAILGWSRMLPSMSYDDPMFGEAVAAIAGGAQLQARLIDDILDVSRIVSGKLRLSPEAIDVSRSVTSAVDAVAATAEAKQISITTTMVPGPGVATADPTRFQQVLWNLLSNALKFTPRGGSVHVSARRNESHVEIAVADDGEGIDPKFLPHLFEPFRQAESPQTRVHGGLGLGLSIVRYLVEAHGGTVTAASEGRGRGATFTVTFPVRAASDAGAVKSATKDTFLHHDRLRGLEILLVDDDDDARKMIAAVLRAAGATVVQVESGGAALTTIAQSVPDLVISDIAMPGMDGYTFSRILRERAEGKSLKIVALSAFPARVGQSGGFDAYLTKPIDPFHLIDDIARIMAR